MNDITPQLKKIFEKARGVRLSDTEKSAMRARLTGYIASESAWPRAPILSPWVMGRFIVSIHRPVAIALIAVLVLSGGTVYAAEGAIPGDALYTIKVDVIEEVRAALTVSDESKMRWDVARAERRLEEAAVLTERGELTGEKEQEIEQRFDSLAEKIEVRAQKVEDAGDSDAAAIVLSEFEGTLRGHVHVLALADTDTNTEVAPVVAAAPPAYISALSAEFPNMGGTPEGAVLMDASVSDTSIAPPEPPVVRTAAPAIEKKTEKPKEKRKLERKVRERVEKLERAREETEHKTENKQNDGGGKKAADDRIQDAEQALKRVEKALESRPKRTDVKSRVNDARVRIEEARQNSESGSSTEAFNEAQAAVRVIQESNVLLKVNDEIIVSEKAQSGVGVNILHKND